MSVLRRVPLWLWGFAFLLAVIVYQRFEMAGADRARNAALDARFHNALQAIDAQRTTTEQERAALSSERQTLKAEVARQKVALKALEGRSQVAGDATARDRVAAEALATHPSYVALEASAGRLGVTIRAVGK